MVKYARIIVVLTVLLALNNPSYGIEKLIQFDELHSYSSDMLYEKAQKLVSTYPYLLSLEVIGYSEDLKPIYVIRMTKDIYNYEDVDYVAKTHILIDGGVHARETFNPAAVLKMVEDYVHDYYNDDYLPKYNVRELMQTSVLHFIPLVNPDGFDVAKRGISTINSAILRQNINLLIPNLRHYRLKANIRGIDVNRNFEDLYFNVKTGKWIDQWGNSEVLWPTVVPGEDFFKGYAPATEAETKTLMAYMLSYDFRAYVTYHSMGQVIYYWVDHLGPDYFRVNQTFANIAQRITNYEMMNPSDYAEFGYSTHYFANNTLKPALTIETTASYDFPTPVANYYHDYFVNRLWAIPLAFLVESKRIGYYDYKLYVNGVYERDFMNASYAQAIADKLDGVIYTYEGKPSYTLSKNASVELNETTTLSRSLMSADGRVYIEFRELFELLAYEISWVKETKQSIAIKDNSTLSVNLSTFDATCLIDGIVVELPKTPKPTLHEGRLMIPIEFLIQIMGIDSDMLKIEEGIDFVFKDL
jgi:hypothetical protein